jgi:HD-like signal output (HDOD) protein
MADYRMGATDGVQFLRKVRAEHPQVTRILMSGFLDQSIFTRFLSSGLVSAFIAQPWEEARLREKVEHVLGIRALLRSKQLLDVVNGLESLPTLPALFHDLVIAVEERKAMKEIASLLERDSSVAARLIHVANSAFFGHRPITNLEEAAVLLGASLLKDLVLTTELAEGAKWSERQRRELEGVFHHSFAVNRMVPVVHRMVYRKAMDGAYGSVGIMHDVGKLVLLRSAPDRYEATVSAAGTAELDAFYRAEIEAGHAGATHAEIGGWLLDYWNFPSPVTEIALFHHQPHRGHEDSARILTVTALANRLVHHAERSASEATVPESPELGVPGLSKETAARLVTLVREELVGIRARFGLQAR